MPLDDKLPDNKAAQEAIEFELTFKKNMQTFLKEFDVNNEKFKSSLTAADLEKLSFYFEPYKELAKQETPEPPKTGKSEDIMAWMAQLAAIRLEASKKIATHYENCIAYIAGIQKANPALFSELFVIENSAPVVPKNKDPEPNNVSAPAKDSEKNNAEVLSAPPSAAKPSEVSSPSKGSRNITDFVIMPVQHIPRYKLMAESIITEEYQAIKKSHASLKAGVETKDPDVIRTMSVKIEKNAYPEYEETIKNISKLTDLDDKQRDWLEKEAYDALMKSQKTAENVSQKIESIENSMDPLEKIKDVANAYNISQKPFPKFKILFIEEMKATLKVNLHESPLANKILDSIDKAKDYNEIKKIVSTPATNILFDKTLMKKCNNYPVLTQEAKIESRIDSALTGINKKVESTQSEIKNIEAEMSSRNKNDPVREEYQKQVNYMKNEIKGLTELKNNIEKEKSLGELKKCESLVSTARKPQGQNPPLLNSYRDRIEVAKETIRNTFRPS